VEEETVFAIGDLVTILGEGVGFGIGIKVCFGGTAGNGVGTIGDGLCTVDITKEEIWIFRGSGNFFEVSCKNQKRKTPIARV
jgi:hypothetical protein